MHECRCVGITCHVILVHIYRVGKHAATQRQADVGGEGGGGGGWRLGEKERVYVKVAIVPRGPAVGRARIRCKL